MNEENPTPSAQAEAFNSGDLLQSMRAGMFAENPPTPPPSSPYQPSEQEVEAVADKILSEVLFHEPRDIAHWHLIQLHSHSEKDRERADKAEALVASYDRQDELIGTEFEGVDEVTEVIRLLKDQLTTANATINRMREALQSIITYCDGDIMYNAIDIRNLYSMAKQALAAPPAAQSDEGKEGGK